MGEMYSALLKAGLLRTRPDRRDPNDDDNCPDVPNLDQAVPEGSRGLPWEIGFLIGRPVTFGFAPLNGSLGVHSYGEWKRYGISYSSITLDESLRTPGAEEAEWTLVHEFTHATRVGELPSLLDEQVAEICAATLIHGPENCLVPLFAAWKGKGRGEAWAEYEKVNPNWSNQSWTKAFKLAEAHLAEYRALYDFLKKAIDNGSWRTWHLGGNKPF